MKNFIKKVLNKLPYVSALSRDVALYKKGYPPGHYYSPVISPGEVETQQDYLFTIHSNKISGIELHEEKQLLLLNELLGNYNSIPFYHEKQDGLRYYFNNNAYAYSDGIFLNLIIRHFKPKRIVEIGSGYSSVAMMDTNELFFNNSIFLTFIEPFPERFYSLCKPSDKGLYKILENKLQDIDISLFATLEDGDFLFIDSTHVSKTGSDVNKILFEILPLLKKGVFIHFHDIFYPFEYPRDWVLGWSGFGWNEIYLIKAFLMHNSEYEIVLFNTFLEHFHEQWFRQNMPLCLKDKGGSLWIRKLV